jgi:hypothetical protein
MCCSFICLSVVNPLRCFEEERMTTLPHSQVGWRFWIKWALAYALAMMVGGFTLWATYFVTGLLAELIFGELAAVYVGLCVSGGLGGAAFGLMNWFLRHGSAKNAHQWVVINTIGGAIGMLLTALVGNSTSDLPEGLALGAAIGALQWLALRRQFRYAAVWIMINMVAWAWALQVTLTMPYGFVAGLAVISAVLSSVMLWLLRYPIQPPKQSMPSSVSSV